MLPEGGAADGAVTDSHREVINKLNELYGVRHWHGVEALEATASTTAAQLREARPDLAAGIYGMLGICCRKGGQHAKVIGLCEQGLEIAVAAGDGTNTGMAYVNLGSVYRVLGQYAKAIKMYEQSMAILEEMGLSTELQKAVTWSNLAICYEAQQQ